MRTPRTIPASLLAVLMLVLAASTAATSGAQAALSSGAPGYAGIWEARTLPQAKRDHGATFRFRVNQLDRVVWVNGSYALNARPACWESGFSLSLRNRRAPIDAEHRFVVRGRSGVNHMFVIRGTMLSETGAKGRLRITKVPHPDSGWGCAGDFRFVWRAHRL